MSAALPDLDDLIDALGYRHGTGLVDPSKSPPQLAHSHLFRRAFAEFQVKAVYTLSPPDNNSAVPLVYLADAGSEQEAAEIHRKVWNQNLVPFLVVSAPNRFVLYPGFRYGQESSSREIADIVKDARLSLDAFGGLDAKSIANGNVWQQRGGDITLEDRVDWQLLQELEQLGQLLRSTAFGLSAHQAHALIGKFVYLRYLRDREILSDKRLAEWNIAPESVFSRDATKAAFLALDSELDTWLNGSVFPIDMGSAGVSEEAVRQVAAVFSGDTVEGQLSLFDAYDFAFIPIETLSVIYQQFLHAEERGKSKGAYYTPVNLVDLILDEVDTRVALKSGTTVLDPACGSGAFLVQVYRRMIERRLSEQGPLRPRELRDLLTRHVFGVDQDEDACRVANLSLIITLLDYVDPPDLLRYPEFTLPALYGTNIVKGDFFDPRLPLASSRFDCIVGNPPWSETKPKQPKPEHLYALRWLREQQAERPVGGYQLAEAFAWKVGEHLSARGVVGILMPAMSLFRVQSHRFRSVFFRRYHCWCVANFANLVYVLFGGRVKEPAAALFFRIDTEDENASDDILTYAPFVANQPAMRSGRHRGFKETWALTVDAGELRRVDREDATSGSGMTWKLAMWGGHRDRRLLMRVQRRFESFSEFSKKAGLVAHQGLELREDSTKEDIEYVPELIGERRIRPKVLASKGRLYDFPEQALEVIHPNNAFVRRGRVSKPMSICRAPHLILGRSRGWVVFSDEFLAVPHPQLGIAAPPGQEDLLKALALYFASDFVLYHQLFHATEMGVRASVADKTDIDALPIPFETMSDEQISAWAELHDRMRDCWRKRQAPLVPHGVCSLGELENRANELVYDALRLSATDRWLVTDLVNGRMRMIQGKIDQEGSKPPSDVEMKDYGEALAVVLNEFISACRHQVKIHHGRDMVVAEIGLSDREVESEKVVSLDLAGDALSQELTEIRRRLVSQHTHWLYFERRLTLFQDEKAYLVKPNQRLHWTRSQALVDADELIADMLAGSGDQA